MSKIRYHFRNVVENGEHGRFLDLRDLESKEDEFYSSNYRNNISTRLLMNFRIHFYRIEIESEGPDPLLGEKASRTFEEIV